MCGDKKSVRKKYVDAEIIWEHFEIRDTQSDLLEP